MGNDRRGRKINNDINTRPAQQYCHTTASTSSPEVTAFSVESGQGNEDGLSDWGWQKHCSSPLVATQRKEV
jgi:hypothetical protein